MPDGTQNESSCRMSNLNNVSKGKTISNYGYEDPESAKNPSDHYCV